jgi:hypothetical protein
MTLRQIAEALTRHCGEQHYFRSRVAICELAPLHALPKSTCAAPRRDQQSHSLASSCQFCSLRELW